MNPWKIVEEKLLVCDRWLTLKAMTYRLPNSTQVSPYYVMEEKEWVHIVAVDDDGRVVTVRQYRPAADAICVELPAGVVETGEASEAAAARELREETGLRAREMLLVGSLWANPARQTNKVHIFVARGLVSEGAQRLDASEDIECGRSSFEELLRMAESGEFGQAMHVGSLAMAMRFLKGRGSTHCQETAA